VRSFVSFCKDIDELVPPRRVQGLERGLTEDREWSSWPGRFEGWTRSRPSFIRPRRVRSTPPTPIMFMNLTCDPWKYWVIDMGLFNVETRERMPVVFRGRKAGR
jgi:hypothetical protein